MVKAKAPQRGGAGYLDAPEEELVSMQKTEK